MQANQHNCASRMSPHFFWFGCTLVHTVSVHRSVLRIALQHGIPHVHVQSLLKKSLWTDNSRRTNILAPVVRHAFQQPLFLSSSESSICWNIVSSSPGSTGRRVVRFLSALPAWRTTLSSTLIEDPLPLPLLLYSASPRHSWFRARSSSTKPLPTISVSTIWIQLSL
jgi:hypothetical protein